MIANSFGVNLQTYACDIAKANNFDLDIYVLYIGGCSLDTHWRNIQSDAKAYELFHNGISTGNIVSIKDALILDDWDMISLQQASHMCGIESTYYPYFGNVFNFVKDICPKAEIIFHKTWAYSPINTFKYDQVPTFYPEFNFKNAKEMKDALDHCSNKVTKEFGITKVIRSGDVVELSMKEFADPYDGQGFHMNGLGCYLIGTNLIKLLSDKCIANVYVPDGLGKETCKKATEFINNNF